MTAGKDDVADMGPMRDIPVMAMGTAGPTPTAGTTFITIAEINVEVAERTAAMDTVIQTDVANAVTADNAGHTGGWASDVDVDADACLIRTAVAVAAAAAHNFQISAMALAAAGVPATLITVVSASLSH
ncbi:hypothetical protein Ciccas_008747 [Cichlidogyrus casuarinus]|uniref:Uncharacterized protein n=1 Tax=Cichlidogyrus casuarinus TaxID=1844966 RepID=A0ABD2Q0N0_9PLAT